MADVTLISRADSILEALEKFDRTGGELLLLVDDEGCFIRVVTEGDARRLLLAGSELTATFEELETKPSIFATVGMKFVEIQRLFAREQVNHIPLISDDNKPISLLRSEDYKDILLSTPHLGTEEQRYVDEAFSTNWIAPVGPNLDGFEAELGNYLGVNSVLAVSSGTAAIHLALIVLGVKRGDTVLCSSLTFAASANPIVYQGAEPVFVDSDECSWNMSPSALKRAIQGCHEKGKKPKALIVVHLYGQMANMTEIQEICSLHNIRIIEDAAESLGATSDGFQSGSFGELGVISFNGNKIITTSGGGALVSNNKALMDHARFLSTQAKEPALHYEHKEIGYNYRMSNVLAGIGRGQLKVLDDRIAARRAIFECYRDNLRHLDQISWMPERPGTFSNRWLSVMLLSPTSDTNALNVIEHLSENGIEARPVWKPLHKQPVFHECDYYEDQQGWSVSDVIYKNGVCLPSGSATSLHDIKRICSLISSFMLK